MRVAALLVLTLAACNHNTGPVAGASDAAKRDYPVTVGAAHDELAKVLTAHYRKLGSDDGRHVVAAGDCRTEAGNRCVPPLNSPKDPAAGSMTRDYDSGCSPKPCGHTQGSPIVADYLIFVYGGVVGEDGHVRIQLGGMAEVINGGKRIDAGDPAAPPWLPHEIDTIRMEIDRDLRSK